MDGVIPRKVSQIGSYEPVCVPLVLNWEAVQDHVRPCSGVTEALVTPQVRLIYKVGLTAKCTQPWNKQNQILSVAYLQARSSDFQCADTRRMERKVRTQLLEEAGNSFVAIVCDTSKPCSKIKQQQKQRLVGRSCCRAGMREQELQRLELHLCSGFWQFRAALSRFLLCVPLSGAAGDGETPEVIKVVPVEWDQLYPKNL